MPKVGADGSILIDASINSTGIKKGVGNIQKSVGGLMSSLKGLAATVGVAFGVAAIVKFGKEAIELGSNITEVQNVVDTAFGDMSYKIEAFSKSSVDNFGISALTAKKTASTYMAMAKGLGLNSDSASNMSIAMTGLTADVASFYNVSQDVADTALKSIFTGETETLKQFGVVMTQTNLQQYAYNQGITKSIDKMSQAEITTLRYQYVMDQLGLAQGDFAKTSGSWANQTRILSERWKEFMSIIGQGLIQALTPALQFLNNAMSYLISFASTFGTVISSIFGGASTDATSAAAGMASIAAATAEASSETDDYTNSANKAAKANKALAGFDTVNKIADSSSGDSSSSRVVTDSGIKPISIGESKKAEIDTSGIKSSIETIKNIFSAFKNWYDANILPTVSFFSDKIKTQLDRLKGIFGDVFGDIIKLGNPLGEWFTRDFTNFIKQGVETTGNIVTGLFDTFNTVFSDIWNLAVYPIMEKYTTVLLPFFSQVGTALLSSLNVLFNNIKLIFDTLWSGAIAPAMEFITTAWGEMWDTVYSVWQERGTAISEGINGFINSIGDIFMSLWNNFLSPLFSWLGDTISWLWDEHLKPLWDNIAGFVGALIEMILTVWNNFLGPLVSWIVSVLGPVISTVFGTIGAVIGSVIAFITDIISGLLRSLGGVLDFITGVFSGNWEKAWQGIVDIFGGIFDMIWGLVKLPINLIIDGLNFLWGAIYSVVAGIVNGIGGIAGAIGDIFGQDWHFSMPAEPPLIPKLASGTVVPPNREFMAVLGDNKREPEIVSPLSTMKQAFKEAFAEVGNTGGSQAVNLHVTAQVDGNTLFEVFEKVKANKGLIVSEGGW